MTGSAPPPPELVGCEGALEQARILLGRVKQKRPEKSILLTLFGAACPSCRAWPASQSPTRNGSLTSRSSARSRKRMRGGRCRTRQKRFGVEFSGKALAKIVRITRGVSCRH